MTRSERRSGRSQLILAHPWKVRYYAPNLAAPFNWSDGRVIRITYVQLTQIAALAVHLASSRNARIPTEESVPAQSQSSRFEVEAP